MVKVKITVGYRIRHWFTYHPWLKLIALGLAVMLWFYIQGSISRTEFGP